MMQKSVEDILNQTSKIAHSYDPVYFKIPRAAISTMLEVGVDRGISLLAWLDLFPFAEVYGIDVRDQVNPEIKANPRIHFTELDAYTGDLSYLPMLDLVVDDANHAWINQVNLCHRLWEKIQPGGWYVIEDIWNPKYIQDAYPKATIIRTGRQKDSVIALIQKEW